MTTYCDKLQERLVRDGVTVLSHDDRAREHCTECESCFQVLDGLPELAPAMDEISDVPLPEALAESILLQVRATPVSRKASEPGLRERFFILFRQALSLPRPMTSALAGALALLLVFVIHSDRDRRSTSRGHRAKKTEQYSDLVQTFKDDINTAKRDQALISDELSKNTLELREHKERVANIFGTVVDKFENLQREVDSLAASLKQQQESPAVDSARNLEGPDELEGFGYDSNRRNTGAPQNDAGFRYLEANPPVIAKPETTASDQSTELGKDQIHGIESQPSSSLQPKSDDSASQVSVVEPASPPAKASEAVVEEESSASDSLENRPSAAEPEERKEADNEEQWSDKNVGESENRKLDPQGKYYTPHRENTGEAAVSSPDNEIRPGRFVPPTTSPVRIYPEAPAPFNALANAHQAKDQKLAKENAAGLIDHAAGPAASLFARWHSTSDASYQAPQGYWANTYLPGDPTTRRLQNALLEAHPDFLNGKPSGPVQLHKSVRQSPQPFDSPNGAALALFLNAERAALSGESRFLVQVGLKGSDEKRGERPALTLALVLDLRGAKLDPESQTIVRELLLSFLKWKQPGDRFSLFVAGRSKQLVLTAETFTHGQITVALKNLFEEDEIREGTASLASVMKRALTSLTPKDDAAALLGSTAAVLIEPGRYQSTNDRVEELVRKSALDGAPVSVIGVRQTASRGALEHLALEGQGSRRFLTSPAESEDAAKKEIASAGEVVARAVRLNIRLAPGVKLVNVLGSYRLDAQAEDRAKAIENALDARIAKNLGIAADRGSDDDGIQILIPGYHAGDAHVVLLDVVAEGPGKIADASVRYKDLVRLKNGATNATLTLPSGTAKAGPLELNVVKNRLAYELSSVLQSASKAIAENDRVRALSELDSFRAVLRDLGSVYPEAARDPDILSDIALLTEYSSLLTIPPPDEVGMQFFRDSLMFAAKARVQTIHREL